MSRYASSWRCIWEMLPATASLSEIHTQFVTKFRRYRHEMAEACGVCLANATINRDLAALGAFLTWCAEEKGISITRPLLRYQRESRGRMWWLTSEQLARFNAHCSPDWEPLFSLLLSTGMTISEALGLRHSDIDLRIRRVSIHEDHGRKLKRASRARELSLPTHLIPILTAWLERSGSNPDSNFFSYTYWTARKAWMRTCKGAGIANATIHDARQTFAVHAVQDGVPEARCRSY